MRNHFALYTSILLVLLMTSACSSNHLHQTAYFIPSDPFSNLSPKNSEHVEAEGLDPAKAEMQAKTDCESGIHKLYAAFGFAPYYPGIKITDVKPSYKTIYIDGTSDFGSPHNQRGVDYASAYNVEAVHHCRGGKE